MLFFHIQTKIKKSTNIKATNKVAIIFQYHARSQDNKNLA